MKSTVNVALIGYAFMGRAHSNAYRQVTPFFNPRLTPRLKVLCGRTKSHVQKAARSLGWDEAATDWEAVVNRPDIDIIDICTPGDSHAEIAIAAARAGKAVLCEKPLANTVREAEQMLAAVRKAGVAHMVCHNYRRVPAVTLAQHLIASGQLGEIRHFRGAYLQDWIVDPEFPFAWRFDRKRAGSGALGDIGAHVIDLARFLVGEIVEVSGDLRTFIKTRPMPGDPKKRGRVTVDDAAIALARFANGATGTIEATRLATGRKNHNRFEINGSKGSVVFDLERLNELELYMDSGPKTQRGFRRILVTESDHPFVKAWWPPGHIIGYEHTFTHTVYDLLEAMADRRVPSPNFADGVKTQRVLDAIEKVVDVETMEDMLKIGVFAVLFGAKPFEETLDYLVDLGLEAVEIGTGAYPGDAHCQPRVLLNDSRKLAAFREAVHRRGLVISALSCHGNPLHPDRKIAKAHHETFVDTVALAKKLDVSTVITFSGCPGSDASAKQPSWIVSPWPPEFGVALEWQWKERVLPYWKDTAKILKSTGVRVAIEMHPNFVSYNPETMLRLSAVAPGVIGCNFDPSHLFWQQADPVTAIRALGDSIYHVHAKDCRIDAANTAVNGVLDSKNYTRELERSWMFRTVGYGHDPLIWKDMVTNLRLVGYDHVISIEHEDSVMSSAEGLKKAIEFLRGVVIAEPKGEAYWA